MRESFWGYWLIILGVFVIVIMMLISNLTTTNTQDYYLIKEVTEQAMVDAVDLAYYRQSGELRINAEKFYESFIRRFAENVALSNYHIEFYGVYEAPPKASVKVVTKSATYNVGTDTATFDIVNKIDAILELDGYVEDGFDSSNNSQNDDKPYEGFGDEDEDNQNNDQPNNDNNNEGNNNNNENNNNNQNEENNIGGNVQIYNPKRPPEAVIKRFIEKDMKDKYFKCKDGSLASNCSDQIMLKEEYKNNLDYFKREAVSDWATSKMVGANQIAKIYFYSVIEKLYKNYE